MKKLSENFRKNVHVPTACCCGSLLAVDLLETRQPWLAARHPERQTAWTADPALRTSFVTSCYTTRAQELVTWMHRWQPSVSPATLPTSPAAMDSWSSSFSFNLAVLFVRSNGQIPSSESPPGGRSPRLWAPAQGSDRSDPAPAPLPLRAPAPMPYPVVVPEAAPLQPLLLESCSASGLDLLLCTGAALASGPAGPILSLGAILNHAWMVQPYSEYLPYPAGTPRPFAERWAALDHRCHTRAVFQFLADECLAVFFPIMIPLAALTHPSAGGSAGSRPTTRAYLRELGCRTIDLAARALSPHTRLGLGDHPARQTGVPLSVAALHSLLHEAEAYHKLLHTP